MTKKYSEVLESYFIDTAMEYMVSYSQKYQNDRDSSNKLSINDFEIVIITKDNLKSMLHKYRHLDLPWFNKKKMLKEGCIQVKVLTKDLKKLVSSAEIFTADLAKKMGVAKNYTEPYNDSKTYLNDLTIRKEFQGKGLGRQIFKYLVNDYVFFRKQN